MACWASNRCWDCRIWVSTSAIHPGTLANDLKSQGAASRQASLVGTTGVLHFRFGPNETALKLVQARLARRDCRCYNLSVNEPSKAFTLRSGRTLLIREASPHDAPELLAYVEAVSSESDFLTFGPGEFELTVDEEETVLIRFHEADNRIYLVGQVDGAIVSTLNFGAGSRPRTRHSGEFGMSVRRAYWGLGIGALMLDAFLEWARGTGVVTKVNLRVRTDNERAIALYRSKGFVLEGTIHQEIYLDGVYYDHHWLGLVL